jgi:hypothetical protein
MAIPLKCARVRRNNLDKAATERDEVGQELLQIWRYTLPRTRLEEACERDETGKQQLEDNWGRE